MINFHRETIDMRPPTGTFRIYREDLQNDEAIRDHFQGILVLRLEGFKGEIALIPDFEASGIVWPPVIDFWIDDVTSRHQAIAVTALTHEIIVKSANQDIVQFENYIPRHTPPRTRCAQSAG